MPRKTPPKHPHRHAIGSSVMDGNGYPTALSPAVHSRLIAELEVGDFPAMAAIRAKCSPRTVERWVTEGCQYAAVEPYASFAADFVRVEAELCAKLTTVILNHALGRGLHGKQKRPKGDPEWAEWMLRNRFAYLWRIDKDGKQGGVSVMQLVAQTIEAQDAVRGEKARALLARVDETIKQEARKEGFLV